MYKICVFGGTTEGRELVEFLNAQPCEVTACVATEYGQALLPEAERLTVSARRLPADEIKALLTDRQFDLVIDATHPYAASITKSIARACAETGVERWRLLRGASDAPEDAVFVESTEKAIEFLDQTEGNILLTTGSKELKAYSQIKDFAERVYARVLPLEDSLVLCREAGVKAAHILAMQGPFSEEMNTAMLRAIGAKWLVTKDGGAAGGFAEKAAAAAKTGVRLLVIGRPAEADGIGLSETVARLCARFSFGRVPHVCVVGIGPGSEAAQTGEVRAAIEHTDCLIGAAAEFGCKNALVMWPVRIAAAGKAAHLGGVLAAYTVAESQIESLVVAKGYADCVVFMGEETVSVVVSDPDGLDAVDVARIKDIVVSETGCAPEQIKIMEAGAAAGSVQTGGVQTAEQADDAKMSRINCKNSCKIF